MPHTIGQFSRQKKNEEGSTGGNRQPQNRQLRLRLPSHICLSQCPSPAISVPLAGQRRGPILDEASHGLDPRREAQSNHPPTHKSTGHYSFYMACGIEPMVPFDITLATFLVLNITDKFSMAGLIAIHMLQLQRCEAISRRFAQTS